MSGKRSNGEGSIFQRKDTGRWMGSVTLGYEDGRTVRKTVSAMTKAGVVKKLDALRRTLDDGMPAPDDRMTVAQLFERWQSDVLSVQVSLSTASNYKTVADFHIIPTLGKKRVSKLTAADIDQLIAVKMKTDLATSTVRRIRSVLVQALDQAVRWDVVGRNVGQNTRGPKEERHEGRTLTPEQARDLIEACEGHRLGAMFITMLTLGLRKGEALGLTWDAIEFPPKESADDAAILWVRQQVSLQGTELIIKKPKTRTSHRGLNVPPQLVKVLRQHRAAQAAERLEVGELWNDTGLVFTTKTGEMIVPGNVNHFFAKVCTDAGIGHWTPHELRHSAASLMMAAGVPLQVASDVLGHASIRITADVYGHILAPQREAAAAAIAGTLWESKAGASA